MRTPPPVRRGAPIFLAFTPPLFFKMPLSNSLVHPLFVGRRGVFRLPVGDSPLLCQGETAFDTNSRHDFFSRTHHRAHALARIVHTHFSTCDTLRSTLVCLALSGWCWMLCTGAPFRNAVRAAGFITFPHRQILRVFGTQPRLSEALEEKRQIGFYSFVAKT